MGRGVGDSIGPARTALVTGASSGIGADLARVLAERGARVGLVARRKDRLEAVAEQCRALGAEAEVIVADLAEPGVPEHVAEEAWSVLGPVDVLVNNAATPGVRHVTRLGADEVEHVMRVNFHAPVRLTLALLPRMLERGAGTVVNVSSLGGRIGIPREAAYCASKFALCGWSESLALDLWRTPIRVKLIIPGAVDTEIWDHEGSEPSTYTGPKVPSVDVARDIADAIDSDRFEHYLPDMKRVALAKTDDVEAYFVRSLEILGV